jgi:hypothetical protein
MKIPGPSRHSSLQLLVEWLTKKHSNCFDISRTVPTKCLTILVVLRCCSAVSPLGSFRVGAPLVAATSGSGCGSRWCIRVGARSFGFETWVRSAFTPFPAVTTPVGARRPVLPNIPATARNGHSVGVAARIFLRPVPRDAPPRSEESLFVLNGRAARNSLQVRVGAPLVAVTSGSG